MLLNPTDAERARGRIAAGPTTSLGLELTFADASPFDRGQAYNQKQSKSPDRSALQLADLVWFSPTPMGRDNFI